MKKQAFHTNHFFKNSVFLLSGILIGASVFLLTQASYTVQTNIDNAVQVIKRIVLQMPDGITGSILSGDTINTVHMQATEYCDEAGGECVDIANVLTGYVETDSVFLAHDANAVTSAQITNRNAAHGRGDHGSEGYLTGYTETDPVFLAHDANAVTSAKITNRDAAHGRGDHGSEGYLTGELDPKIGTLSTNKRCKATSGLIVCDQDEPAGGAGGGGERSTGTAGEIYYNNGNVGIGTTNPQAKLQVSGNIVPETTNTSKLGTDTLRRNLFANDAIMYTLTAKDIKGSSIIAKTSLVIPVHKLAPASPVNGQMYFQTEDEHPNKLRIFYGTGWHDIN